MHFQLEKCCLSVTIKISVVLLCVKISVVLLCVKICCVVFTVLTCENQLISSLSTNVGKKAMGPDVFS